MKRSSMAGSAALGLMLAASLFCSTSAFAQETIRSAGDVYQQRFCAGMRFQPQFGLQRHADCISETHAIEVDWHDEWKESIGQALVFGAKAKLTPGIVLVCRSDQAYCLDASLSVRQTLDHHHVTGTLWDCLPIHKVLADCTRWEMTGPTE